VCIVAAHGAAAACLWLLLPGVVGVTLALLVQALGVAVAWDRALLGASSSVEGLDLGPGDTAVLRHRDGRRTPASVGQGRFVSRVCVTLPVQARWQRSLIITSGMLKAEPFRVLRLWALWGRVPGSAPVASRQLPA